MLALLESPGKAALDAAQGFGSTQGTSVETHLVPEAIGPNASRRVTTVVEPRDPELRQVATPGICSRACHSSAELDSYTSWTVPTHTPAGGGRRGPAVATWTISDATIYGATSRHLDSGLSNQYAQASSFPEKLCP